MFTKDNPIKLRSYQEEAIRDTLRSFEIQKQLKTNNNYFALICSVASGKTLMSIIIAKIMLSSKTYGIDKVLITTPQNLIMNGFEKHSVAWVEYLGCVNKLPYISRGVSTNAIKSWFISNNSGIMMCCNNSIVSKNSKCCDVFQFVTDCSNILWIIDEAHHKDAKKLGPIIDDFRSKGGKVLYLTATPYNVDGVLDIVFSLDKCYVRTLSQQMIDGYCPILNTKWVLTKSNINENYYDPNIMAKYIMDQLIEDNFPKVAIIIPSVRSGKNSFRSFSKDDYGDDEGTRLKAVSLIASLTKISSELKRPLKILNIVGTLTDDIKKELDMEIKTGDRYDVIVACRRLDEGVDITTLNAVYQFGISTDRVREQRSGRICRNKKGNKYCEAKHPDYLEKSKYVIFINDVELTKDDQTNLVALSLLRTIFASQNLEAYDRIINLDICQKIAKENIRKLKKELEKTPNDERIKSELDLEEDVVKVTTDFIINATYPEPNNLYERERLSQSNATFLDAVKDDDTKNVVLSEIANEIPGEQLYDKIRLGCRKRSILGNIEEDPVVSSILKEFKDKQLTSLLTSESRLLLATLCGKNIKEYCDLFTNRDNILLDELIKFRTDYGHFPIRRGENCSENYLYDLYIKIRRSNAEKLFSYKKHILKLKKLFGENCFGDIYPSWVYEFIELTNREHRLPTYSEVNLYSSFRNFKLSSKDWKQTSIGKYILENVKIKTSFSSHIDISDRHCTELIEFHKKNNRLPSLCKDEKKLATWYRNYTNRKKNDPTNPIIVRLKEAGCL